mmetsp:Transcript_111001/g.358317  ORF Transcript_111001/g.358317 Transcript_111001/m.358317 type:complete len:583 (-) Transcript_111001:104-1852(-)
MTPWVKVPTGAAGAESFYYWRAGTQETSWSEPVGVKVQWVAQKAESGLTYYWNTETRETTWESPTQSFPSGAASMSSTASCASACSPPVSGWQFVLQHCGRQVEQLLQGASRSELETGAGAGAAANPQDANAADGRGGEGSAAAWVEVLSGVPGQSYYWNFCRGISVLSPPARVCWRAYRAPSGDYYYQDTETGNTSWSIPGLPKGDREGCEENCREAGLDERWVELGAAVRVHSLTESTRYNDQVGEVVDYQDGRVIVRTPDCLGGMLLAVRPRNVAPLLKSTIVELRDLEKAANLNGQIATVEELGLQERRFHVKLRDGAVKSVLPTRAIPRSRLWDLNMGVGSCWLQWRKEQSCLFIDSTGQHRKFSLHLPLSFAAAQKEAKGSRDRAPCWPMLVYLHGAGGSSFFTHSRKTLRSNGLQHAAGKFVVVSPQCDWTWKDTPKPWVTELVLALRAGDWVDPNRIYLTGCSMGGMSTWELAAARPDLFAAIAPVAGHHQVEHEPMLARNLRGMCIFVVHSQHDETCPMRLEESLWHRLMHEEANGFVQLNLAPQIPHCSMFERAYCDDTTLYDWLLMCKRDA